MRTVEGSISYEILNGKVAIRLHDQPDGMGNRWEVILSYDEAMNFCGNIIQAIQLRRLK